MYGALTVLEHAIVERFETATEKTADWVQTIALCTRWVDMLQVMVRSEYSDSWRSLGEELRPSIWWEMRCETHSLNMLARVELTAEDMVDLVLRERAPGSF